MSRSARQAYAGSIGIAWALGSMISPSHAAALQRMTKEKVEEYEARFSAQDPRFAQIYAPDVTFPHITFGNLRGPKQIADHYKQMWASGVHEVRRATAIVIDNEGGTMAVEERVRFKTKPGFAKVTLPTGEVMRAGEEWQGAAVMFFTIRDGKVTSVRGSILGPGKISRVTPATTLLPPGAAVMRSD